jgi:predicted phosphohydrolase
VTAQDIAWLKHQLDSVKRSSLITHHSSLNPTPIFVFTHYPLLPGDVDNWSKVTKVLRKYNVQCILGGHYHRNIFFDCDGIINVLNRSNQRGNDTINGYSIISVSDSIRFYERRLGEKAKGERREAKEAWLCLPFIVHN